MNYRNIFFIVTLLFVTAIIAQENKQHFSVGIESNSQYNIDDAVTGDFEEDNPFRSNNYIKMGYDINDFSFGLQLESYAPQAILNYSPKFDSKINIGTFQMAYNKKKWGVTLGHFYEQFGSGLVLRSWEDRQLGINNAILGAKVTFNPTDKIRMTALSGKQRTGFKVSEGLIYGFDTNVDLSSENNLLSVGASVVGRYQESEFPIADFNPTTYAFSGRTNFTKGNVFANIEAVVKTKDAYVDKGEVFENSFYGNAVKLDLGYSKKGMGVVATLRRMENMSFFSDREAGGNLYQEQNMNYIPAYTKQQEYGLANIYTYVAQPGINFNPQRLKVGEIGGQIDVFYTLKKETKLGGKYGTKVKANFSNWYGLGADYLPQHKRVNVSAFDFGEEYFRDFNLEVKKKLSKKTRMVFTYINSFYNKSYVGEQVGEIYSNIFVVDVKYKLSRKKSIRMDVQGLWTMQDTKDWVATTIEFTPNTHFAFFALDMYNYGNDHEDDKNHYFSVGSSYSKGRSRFALSYGRQRAGLLCVGGVCREVPASTGLTFGVTTSF